MAKYVVEISRISEGRVQEGGHFNFERYLFNEPAHLLSQPCQEVYCFHLWSSHHRIEARFNLFILEGIGLSPCRAPFGAIEFNPGLDIRHLDYLLDSIEDFASSHKLGQLRIMGYPFSYATEAAQTLTHRLLARRFALFHSDLCYHLSVSALPFEFSLHETEKRRLKKCKKAGFYFSMEMQPDLDFVYEFIKTCRERRGYSISLLLKDFKELFFLFPQVYQVFSVRDGNNMLALTVTVRINERILYNFYPADATDYHTYSPIVMLTEGLYNYCLEGGMGLLDLGSAPNYGLIRFKKNLGAQASLKLSFEKQFTPHYSAGGSE